MLLGRVRRCVLRLAVRQGALTPDVAADLARWGDGGFSLHAAVRIEAEDRAGLERLLRYCARPAFTSERLAWDGSDQPVRYSLPKPLPTGQTELTLTPPELATDGVGTAAFAFDQFPSWDPLTPPPDPGFNFDQTLA